MKDLLLQLMSWRVLAPVGLALLGILLNYARAPRLLIRLALHPGPVPILRALLHNAEQSIGVDGLQARLTIVGPRTVEGTRATRFTGPDFRGRAWAEEKDGDLELHVHADSELRPGRSWLFEVACEGAEPVSVRCVVSPGPRSAFGEKVLRVVRKPSGTVSVARKDTLHPYVFPVVSFVIAFVSGLIVLELLGTGTADWVATTVFGLGLVLAGSLLHWLLRPITPYVAVGYRNAAELPLESSK